MEPKLNDLQLFVENLELPPILPSGLEDSNTEPRADYKKSGSVVGGSLVSFTSSLLGLCSN